MTFNGKLLRYEEFLNQIVKTLGIILDKRTKRKPGKNTNVAEIETNAFKEYIKDVKTGAFPTDDHVYHIKKGKEEEFYETLKKFERKT